MRSSQVYSSILILICFVTAVSAQSDLRADALGQHEDLRQQGVTERLPDEMRSLDATLATAEMYYQLNDSKNAQRYYEHAQQKAMIIRKKLLIFQTSAETNSAPAVPIPAPASAVQARGSSAVPAPSQAMTERAEQGEITDSFSSPLLIGSVGTYVVKKGDTIRLVAAKLGVSRSQLATMNKLNLKDTLKVGQPLLFNNRRIIPEHRFKEGILINIPDRMLYLFQQGNLAYATAVALGTPTRTEQFIWETPTGKFRIVNKAKDPTWTVPPSIQEEMRLEGKEVITSIPPGPENPLGRYAMKTSLPGILIHSTTKPWSIYTYASHGCIRVYPDRMEELFKLVRQNMPGEIIYKPVKLAVTDEGRVLLEAHADIYNKTRGLHKEAQTLIRARGLEDKVDWKKVKQTLSRRSGVAEDVTRPSPSHHNVLDTSRNQSPS